MGGPFKSAAIILALAWPASATYAQNAAGTDVFGDDVGDGVAAYTLQYYDRAREIWTPHAENGHTEAEYRMGTLYDYGRIGGTRDASTAADWYKKAGAKGHMLASYALANMYAKGDGVDHNINESFNWFLKAADAGHPKAQYHVARQYLSGGVVPQDIVASYVWARRTAENPNAGPVGAQGRAAMAVLEPAMTRAQKEEAASKFR